MRSNTRDSVRQHWAEMRQHSPKLACGENDQTREPAALEPAGQFSWQSETPDISPGDPWSHLLLIHQAETGPMDWLLSIEITGEIVGSFVLNQ